MKQYLKSQTAISLGAKISPSRSNSAASGASSAQYNSKLGAYGAAVENDFDPMGGCGDLDFLEITCSSDEEEEAGAKAFQLSPRTLALQASLVPSTVVKRDRPALLKVTPISATGFVQRLLEIPRDLVGLIIGQSGKKIKELCSGSGAKIQFRQNKAAERDRRPATLEVQGSLQNVDTALQLIWDTLQSYGKEYNEVPFVVKSKK